MPFFINMITRAVEDRSSNKNRPQFTTPDYNLYTTTNNSNNNAQSQPQQQQQYYSQPQPQQQQPQQSYSTPTGYYYPPTGASTTPKANKTFLEARRERLNKRYMERDYRRAVKFGYAPAVIPPSKQGLYATVPVPQQQQQQQQQQQRGVVAAGAPPAYQVGRRASFDDDDGFGDEFVGQSEGGSRRRSFGSGDRKW